MPRFAANLSMLYPELEFLDRFEAAAKDGFEAVEVLFPYAYPAAEILARLKTNGLKLVLINAPPGHWEAGERGIGCLPGREAEFRRSVTLALDHASALECAQVHVMAGLVPEGAPREPLRALLTESLRWAAAEAARQQVDILIEPINTRDMPGYLLNRQDEAHRIVADVGAPNLKVQMDLYHCQIMEGDIAKKLQLYLPTGRVGHLQIAGVPDRHEPDQSELDYAYVFAIIDELIDAGQWNGWIGCEYRPSRGAIAGGTTAGLGWMGGRGRSSTRPPAN